MTPTDRPLHFPLTKTLDPTDLASDFLHPFQNAIETHFDKASPQHPQRKWEYSMALAASEEWWSRAAYFQGPHFDNRGYSIDVGGAGSPFHFMSGAEVVDPTADSTCVPNGPRTPRTLHEWMAAHHAWHKPTRVFCISVIEHIPDKDYFQFLRDLADVTAPGGLLFLTMDCCDSAGEDNRHFHWMRERIYSMMGWRSLYQEFRRMGFSLLGEADWEYKGNQVYDYSFASLALVKEK